jgi:type I restriction enzyme S subunit
LDEPQDAVFSGFVLRARLKNDSLDDGFRKYCFASLPVRKQITSKSAYTTRALTNDRVLSAVSLACPPKEEQTAIAGVLSDMDAEVGALEARWEKTRQIKRGMMQELLTGRTRLV